MSTIEVLASPEESFILRAVVPTKYAGQHLIDGIPCQQQVVTRDAHGASDSVELIARVPSKNPGGLSTYEVTESRFPYEVGVPPMRNFAPITVDATTTDGQVWQATFTESDDYDVVKEGRFLTTVRGFKELDNGRGGKLFGVHIYLTFVEGDPNLSFDVRVSNANVESVLGGVYFTDLRVTTESRASIVPRMGSNRIDSVRNGNVFWICEDAGYHHYFPKQASFHRRLLIVNREISPDTLAWEKMHGGVGFSNAWHQKETFGVTKTRIGRYTNAFEYQNFTGREAIREKLLDKALDVSAALESGGTNGGHGIYSINFGPFHPIHRENQGGPGGFEIRHYSGYELCSESILVERLRAHMYSERQAWNMYRADGTIKTVDDWAHENNGFVPFDFIPMDFHVNAIPAFREAGNWNEGDADDGITDYRPIDRAHQCRNNKPWQALVYLTNDPLARDELRMAAEVNLLCLHNYPNPQGWSSFSTLAEIAAVVTENPAQGHTNWRRDQMWQIDSICSYYAIADIETRSHLYAWMKLMTETILKSSMDTGFLSRVNAGQVYDTADMPDYDAAQAFELAFEQHAKMCLYAVAFRGRDSRYGNALLRSVLVAAESLFESDIYDGNNYRWFVATARHHGSPLGQDELSRALTTGGNEIFQGWFVLSLAAQAEIGLGRGRRMVRWLNHAKHYRETHSDKVSRLFSWSEQSWNDHLPQAIGLIGMLQYWGLHNGS